MSAKRTSPTLAIVLVFLACIRFEFRTPTWEIALPGLAGGLLVIAILALVFCYRIFNSIEKLLLSKNQLTAPVEHRYDSLVPAAIVAVIIKYQLRGSNITDIHGQTSPQWEFHWSDAALDVPFVLAIVGLVGLLRIYDLLGALADPDRSQS